MTSFDQFLARISYGGFFDPLSWAVGLWLFAFGACAGSFMNVVVWRLPLGRSLTFPGSRCPNCGHAVRVWDNIPILNWFILRGRCRDCKVPISWRYPAVEALVAVTFVGVALAEPLITGANLPRGGSMFWYEGEGLITLWVLYFVQMLLICTLICSALMWFDGSYPPERLFAPVALIGVFGPLVQTALRPEPTLFHWGMARAAIAAESVLGVMLAMALGRLIAAAVYPSSDKRSNVPAIWEIASIAVVFGLPASTRIVAVAAAVGLAAAIASRLIQWIKWVPWTVYLIAACILQISLWRETTEAIDRIEHGRLIATAAAIAVAVACLVLIKLLRRDLPVAEPGWNRDWPVSRRPSIMPSHRTPEVEAILKSPSYKLAELDTDFLQRAELRPVRMQLELLKPEMILAENKICSTIVAFGGTQIVEKQEAQRRLEEANSELAQSPDDAKLKRKVERLERLLAKAGYYDAAREFARLSSQECQSGDRCDFVIVTGGGPGIMEAANRGAHDVGAKSIGMNITLPEEQVPNPYITPELCFQFHYFALRKMHLVLRAKALVVFPGGFGTFDELFEVLTLRQTNRMQAIPIILFGREYWERAFDFQFLADEGVIADEHLSLIEYAETPAEAWEIIRKFHNFAGTP